MAQYRVLPAMLDQLKFGSGSNPVLLATVLKLGSKLPEEDLDKMVIPAVVQMFSNNERSTRINLLKHVKQYIEYIPDDIVEKQIFPNVISGFAGKKKRKSNCCLFCYGGKSPLINAYCSSKLKVFIF